MEIANTIFHWNQENNFKIKKLFTFYHKNMHFVLEFCSAGYFSKDGGLGACVPCPRGSYQPNPKGSSCIMCPSGMTTVDDGASSSTQCKAG